jgi:cell division protein FtsW
LHYLPEAHTDFVFAVAAEELGLLGVLVMAALFVMLVGALLAIARNCSRAGDAYGTFFCIGAAMLVGLQAFFNMGVNMGVLPTKGLTLPLVSYGGSSLVAMGLLLGMVWQVGGAAGAAPAVNGKARARRAVAA